MTEYSVALLMHRRYLDTFYDMRLIQSWMDASNNVKTIFSSEYIDYSSQFAKYVYRLYDTNSPLWYIGNAHTHSNVIYKQEGGWRRDGDWWHLSGPWWRHQMETFSALPVLCAGNSQVTGEIPSQKPVTRNFDFLLHLCLNKRLKKQWWCLWSETPSRS